MGVGLSFLVQKPVMSKKKVFVARNLKDSYQIYHSDQEKEKRKSKFFIRKSKFFITSRTHVYAQITPCLFNFTGRRRLTVEDALAIAAAISDDAKPTTLTLPSDGSILKVFESKHFLLISS
jgi:hypothetical protein